MSGELRRRVTSGTLPGAHAGRLAIVLADSEGHVDFGASPTLTGERRLLLAVLEDAVKTYRKHRHAKTPQGRALFEEERDWFDGIPGKFSFTEVCAYLGFEPDYIRRGIDLPGPLRLVRHGSGERSPQGVTARGAQVGPGTGRPGLGVWSGLAVVPKRETNA